VALEWTSPLFYCLPVCNVMEHQKVKDVRNHEHHSNCDVVARDTSGPPLMACLWMNWRGDHHVLNVRWTLWNAFYFGPTLASVSGNSFVQNEWRFVRRDTRRHLFNVVLFGEISGFDFREGPRDFVCVHLDETGSGIRPTSWRKQDDTSDYIYIYMQCFFF
jgi:hypothetical protein